MKYISALCWRAFILAAVFTVNFSRAQSAGSGYVVTARGPDYAIHQKTTVENGVNRVHQYTELATGLNYTNSSGQLVPAVEEIDILPNGGAVANHGRHTVSFPGDIYTGKIEVVTPDGLHLKSRPLAISYDDGTNTVLIGVLTNASGFVVGSNQVVYPNAFTGLNADIRYTYRKGGFEQDVVLNEQPPAPEAFGLNSQTVHLQVLTEFFNPPEPKQTKTNLNSKASRQAVSSDTTLTFGKMKMIHGKAFSIGSSGGDSAQTNRSRFTSAATRNSQPSTLNSQPVSKIWVHLQGRTFLVEELPVPAIAAQLQQLPVSAAVSMNSASPLLHKVSATRLLPPERPVQESTVQLAKADIKYKSGFVLDYNTVDAGLTNFTFQSGQTYLIMADCYMSGTTVFEGGATIKSGNYGACLDLAPDWENDQVVCETSADNPAIFTSKNDNSVGETVYGAIGDPSPEDTEFLIYPDTDMTLSGMRFSYAQYPIYASGFLTLWDCQITHADTAIICGNDLSLHNVLIAHVAGAIATGNLTAENVTVDDAPGEMYVSGAYLTNCLITSSGGPDNIYIDGGSLNTNQVVWLPSPSEPVYEAGAGAESYYLTSNSPYRNAGTTGIDPSLLAELQTMTTYAPQDGGYPDNDGQPDLGYHYPVNADTDSDGLPDAWEFSHFGGFGYSTLDLAPDGYTYLYDYQHNLNPEGRLAYWSFNNTNTWAGGRLGWMQPFLATNVFGIAGWSTNAVRINSTNLAVLKLRASDLVNSQNINLWAGTIRFWMKPDWNSADQGGTGPQSEARLVEAGAKGTTNGWWALCLGSGGTNIYFCTQTNSAGTLTTNLNAAISLASNSWHQIVLTYSPENSALYFDGQPVLTNGLGISFYPNINATGTGFTVGSSASGTNQIKGALDELETFNYAMDAAQAMDGNGNGLPDWWEWQKFGNFDQTGSGDYDGDGYSNLQEYLNGSNPADPASVPFKVFITRPRSGSFLP